MSTGDKARPTAASAKVALVAKYDHLAKIANSDPKRRKYSYRADKYRRQVENLERLAV